MGVVIFFLLFKKKEIQRPEASQSREVNRVLFSEAVKTLRVVSTGPCAVPHLALREARFWVGILFLQKQHMSSLGKRVTSHVTEAGGPVEPQAGAPQ